MSGDVKKRKTAVIGLGSMGYPMAKHMLAHGFDVLGYDINPESLTKAEAIGVRTVPEIRAIEEDVEVVVLMVQTDGQVKEVIMESGLLDRLQPGAVICVASSTSPFTCQELSEKLLEKDVGLLDTPVVLGQQAADEGRLTVFVGGEERWLERAEPVLKAFGKEVIHIGKSGAGQLAKTANNLLLWACMSANYEVLSLCRKMDVNIEKLIEGLNKSSGANWSLSRWGKSTGKWAEKDMDVALDLAQTLKVSMPLSGLVDQLMKGMNQEKMKALLK